MVLLRAQQVPLDFARGGFGEFGDEAEFVGAFEGGEAGAKPAVDFAIETAGGIGDAGAEDYVGDRAEEADGVGVPYDGAFGYGIVG
jgi:hypothetical protein